VPSSLGKSLLEGSSVLIAAVCDTRSRIRREKSVGDSKIRSIAYFPSTAPPNAANFATLREIEGRLKSIRNIEKITKTMKIVASTRLTRAQKAMEDSRIYGQTSNTVFEKAETKPLEDKKTLIVVASSDKGLCGGIHSSLSKATRRLLAEIPNADVVVLGEKAKAQLGRSNPQSIVLSFSQVCKDIPTFADAQAIADQIALLPTDYASVKIMYNKFINAQSYEATVVEGYSEEAIANSRESPFLLPSRHLAH
jgi:F-type H+-transporting ATPase subunit gamma